MMKIALSSVVNGDRAILSEALENLYGAETSSKTSTWSLSIKNITFKLF